MLEGRPIHIDIDTYKNVCELIHNELWTYWKSTNLSNKELNYRIATKILKHCTKR